MTDNGPRLVLLGKQGAGKGTQAQRIADHYGIVHLSTGDLFRQQAAAGTEFGVEARRYMDSGELVPDDIVIGIVRESLAPGGLLSGGWVLDGFPRTLQQAEALDGAVDDDRPVDLAVNIEVPHEIVLDRLAGRRVCEVCGRIYHVNMPPRENWTCDDDGGAVTQRPDDTERAIDRRLQIYDTETLPIVRFYATRGHLEVVDGVGTGDEVFGRIVRAVDERLASTAR